MKFTINDIIKRCHNKNGMTLVQTRKFTKRFFELVRIMILEGDIYEFPENYGKIATYRREQKVTPPKAASYKTVDGKVKMSWHDQVNIKRIGWYYGTFWRFNRAHYLGYIFRTNGLLKTELGRILKQTDIEYRAYVSKKISINT